MATANSPGSSVVPSNGFWKLSDSPGKQIQLKIKGYFWHIGYFCPQDTEYTYYSWCMTSTDIVKWRKTKDYENFEKGMIYMKILKKRG